MRTKLIPAFAAIALSLQTAASEPADSLTLGEVVVTGSRDAVNPRHLSQTVTVVGRRTIEADMQQSLLPTLTEHVPGLFIRLPQRRADRTGIPRRAELPSRHGQ